MEVEVGAKLAGISCAGPVSNLLASGMQDTPITARTKMITPTNVTEESFLFLLSKRTTNRSPIEAAPAMEVDSIFSRGFDLISSTGSSPVPGRTVVAMSE